MSKIIRIEGRIGVSGGVMGETLRQCVAGIASLDTRMRNQELTHEVSERESSEEIHN